MSFNLDLWKLKVHKQQEMLESNGSAAMDRKYRTLCSDVDKKAELICLIFKCLSAPNLASIHNPQKK